MMKKRRTIWSLLLAIILCMSMLYRVPVKAENSVKIYEGDFFSVTFRLVNRWETSYQAEISIENTGSEKIKNWYLRFELANTITNLWNGSVDTHIENSYIIKNEQWNQNISPSEQITFGFIADGAFSGFPEAYELLGENKELKQQDYTIKYEKDSEWGDGFTGTISITNNTDKTLENWTLAFDFTGNLNELWNGFLLSKQDNHYIVTNAEYNSYIPAGETVTFGFSGEKGNVEEEPSGYKLHVYDNAIHTKTDTEVTTEQEVTEGETTEKAATEETSTEQLSDNVDTDGDGLSDAFEYAAGLDYLNPDTDGDGLTDYEELYDTWTDPLKKDSDGNGIHDGDEDLDRDGLSNREELDLGTEPFNGDTDRDNLTDYEELYTYQTNPLKEDTDGDGLLDYDDILLGFSPLLQDTDDNGISDPDEKVYQTVSETIENQKQPGVTEVEVSLKTKGNAMNQIRIHDIYGIDTMSSDVVGLIGVPVEIQCDADFEEAELTFHYDENALGDTAEEDLAIMWYDKENEWYQILDQDSIIDTEKNTVTYTTTHFSTYMLVNSKEWHDAWKENIDYREGLSEGESQPHDYYFIIDSLTTQSAEELDAIKNVVSAMVSNMNEDDHVGYVRLQKNGKISYQIFVPLNRFSLRYVNKENWYETSKRYPIYVVEDVMWNNFKNFACSYKQIVIMVGSDTYGYSQKFVDKCRGMDIKIYAINVGTENNPILEAYAQRTGGEYYDVPNTEDCETVLSAIMGTVGEMDSTDQDMDGLYDVYETVGMRLPNGRVIYTDPTLPDTDNDGLTDAQETGIIYNIENQYIGSGMTANVSYFKMRSYPDIKDSDNDNAYDKLDKMPLTAELGAVTIAELHNRFFEDEYLRIKEDIHLYAGGNQGWWDDKVDMSEINGLDYMAALKKDKYYRLSNIGCGTIAMCDMELYMYFQNEGYHLNSDVEIDKEQGYCNRGTYRQYVEDMYAGKYEISSSYIDRQLGLPVWDMEEGFSDFLTQNQHKYKCVTWANYCRSSQRDAILDDIKRMLEDNVPVVFSYYDTNEENKIPLYPDIEAAIKNKTETFTNSHYMTITGLYKLLDFPTYRDRYILKIVSWGTEYYIDFNAYAESISYFSNILSAYEGGW